MIDTSKFPKIGIAWEFYTKKKNPISNKMVVLKVHVE